MAPYAAMMAALLGDIARRGRTGTLLLDAVRGEPGGALRFDRGRLVRFDPPAGSGGPLRLSGTDLIARLRREIPLAAAACGAAGARARFDPAGPAAPAAPAATAASDASPALTAADLALEVGRQVTDAGWLEDKLGMAAGERLIRPDAPPAVQPTLALGAGEGFLLSRADGSLTLQEIIDTAPLGRLETLRALFSLEVAGLLATAAPAADRPAAGRLSDLDRFLQKTAPAAGDRPPDQAPDQAPDHAKERDDLMARCRAVAGQDHYTVLGVERSAAEPAVRAAYYRLARKYHPDRLHRPHLEGMQRDLEGMFAAITEAYNTLSVPARRAEYDKELMDRTAGRGRPAAQDKLVVARDAYQKGRREAEAGRHFEALRLFEVAIQNDPSRAEYYHHLGVCQGQNPRWRKKAEENLLKAISLSPGSSRSYLELARVYHKGGLERRALDMYGEVLRWEPDNAEALAALGRGKEAGGAGLLGGLFRKD